MRKLSLCILLLCVSLVGGTHLAQAKFVGQITFIATPQASTLSQLYEIDADGANFKSLSSDLHNVYASAWSPDGSRLAVTGSSKAESNLTAPFIYTVKDDKWTPLLVDFSVGLPSWAPDNAHLFLRSHNFAKEQSGDPDGVRLVDVASATAKTIIDGQKIFDLIVSPDGRKVAFNGLPKDSPLIHFFIMDADGNNLHDLGVEKQLYNINHPVFSPDSSMLAFDMNPNVYTYNLATGNFAQLGVEYLEGRYPSWSPDSKHIAFAGIVSGGSRGYYVSTTDGQTINQAVNGADYTNLSAWAPDGSAIAVVCVIHQNAGIYVVNADFTDIIEATQAVEVKFRTIGALSWRPTHNE